MKAGDFGAINVVLKVLDPTKEIKTIKPSDGIIIGAVFEDGVSLNALGQPVTNDPGEPLGTPVGLADTDLTKTSTKIIFTVPDLKNTGPLGKTGQIAGIKSTTNAKPQDAANLGIQYMLFTLDNAGKLQHYAANSTRVVIAYALPKNLFDPKNAAKGGLLLNDSSNNQIVYQTSLRAFDKDVTFDLSGHPSDCGNASWSFTANGTQAGGSGCIENSFLVLGVVPSNGKATPGSPVYAIYADESDIPLINTPGVRS